jgi:peptidoglycan/xylan/chitin deacetylase (PgdA/CDA1 family)
LSGLRDIARRSRAFLRAQVLRLSGRRVGAALVYHRVGDPAGDPSRELVPNMGVALFEAQIRHLRACYRLVRASELPDAIASRRRGERLPVAITFDDDLASHNSVAAPILERLGAPATFFLTGASLEGPARFWWEDLQAAVDEGRTPADVLDGGPEQIHAAAQSIKLMSPERRTAVAEELERLVRGTSREPGLSAADVARLAGAGHEIGFHTRRHHYLPNLEPADLERSMLDGRDDLEAAAGTRIRSIAYPHGGADARVAEAARSAGFQVGYTTEATVIGVPVNPMLAGRIEPSFASVGALARELSRGLSGA